MSSTKCIRCGAELAVEGALYSPMRMSFRPMASKFLTLETGDVLTKAEMCRQCGHIEITGDVRKLARLASEGKPEGGSAP